MTYDIKLIKEFSDNSPNPTLFRNNLIATDQLLSILDREAFIQKYEHRLETAKDYNDAYLCFNCFTFENWDELLKSENEMNEFKLSEQQLKELIGSKIFQLDCGYWVQFS